jgi:hypothetical protein
MGKRSSQARLIERLATDDTAADQRALSPDMRASMERHLRDQHGYRDFRLDRDLYLGGGKRSASKLLSFDSAQARYWCSRCPGVVLSTGEITDEMVARVQLFDEGLRSRLTGLDPAERDEMARSYLSGQLNREELRRLRGAGPRRRVAAVKRPVVAERRQRVQAWMLERMRVLGVLERVLDEAEEMQRTDLERWLRIAHRRLARGTIRKYWDDIDPAVRTGARAQAQRS